MFNRKLFLATMIALLAVLLIVWVVTGTPGDERSGHQVEIAEPATSAGAIAEELSSPTPQPPTVPEQAQPVMIMGGASVTVPE